MDDPQATEAPKHSSVRRVLGGVVSVGLVVLIFVFLVPQLTTASLSDVLAEIDATDVVIMLLLGLVHLGCNWSSIVVSLRGLSFPKAGIANLSGAAVSNSLPEGGAFGTALTYGIFHSWGFGTDKVTASLMSTGAWSQLVRYSMLAGALIVLAVQGSSGTELVHALLIAAVMAVAVVGFIKLIHSEAFAEKLGHGADRPSTWVLARIHKGPTHITGWVLSLRRTLADVADDRGKTLTFTTFLGEGSAVLLLLVALRLMGISDSEANVALIITAYAGASLASMVLPTPGGLGVVEAAMLAILGTSVPDSQDAQMTAAIVLYRLATWLEPTVLGIPAYVTWRLKRSWRIDATAEAATGA